MPDTPRRAAPPSRPARPRDGRPAAGLGGDARGGVAGVADGRVAARGEVGGRVPPPCLDRGVGVAGGGHRPRRLRRLQPREGVLGREPGGGPAKRRLPDRSRAHARHPLGADPPGLLRLPPPGHAVLEHLLRGQPGDRAAADAVPGVPLPPRLLRLPAQHGPAVVVGGAGLVRAPARGPAAAPDVRLHGHGQLHDVRGPRLAAGAGLLQPRRGDAEPARGHGAGRGLGPLGPDPVGVVARPGPRLSGAGGGVDRGHRQPLHPGHPRRARRRAARRGPRVPAGARAPGAGAARGGPCRAGKRGHSAGTARDGTA